MKILSVFTLVCGLCLTANVSAQKYVVEDGGIGLSAPELEYIVRHWTPEMQQAAANDMGDRLELLNMALASKKIAAEADKLTEADGDVYWKSVRLMNPNNSKRPLAPMPRKILKELVECSPRPLTSGQIAERLDTDSEKFSYASYRQHIKTLRRSFDVAEGDDGKFIECCNQGAGIVTFGDEGAYCWKPPGAKQ